ncbi:MAG: M16 family metallopeptidase, partial [Candidatus Kapaibacterium sp.]
MPLPEPDTGYAPLAFALPPWSTLTLSSGVRMHCIPDMTQELLSVTLVCGRGATEQTRPSQAVMTGAMLTRGTRMNTAPEIADIVDALGASIRSSGNRDAVSISISGLAKHHGTMIRILAECAVHPSFDEEEFERLRALYVSDHELSLAYPGYCASQAFSSLAYADHPYGTPLNGTKADLESVTAQDCRRFQDSMKDHAAWTVVVAGAFDHDVVTREVDEALADLRPSPSVRPDFRTASRSGLVTGYSVGPSAQQTVFQIGQHCIGRLDPDYAALTVLNTLFGEYFLSRLNSVLREEKGFTYGVHSSLAFRRHGYLFLAWSSVSAENLEESLSIVLREWQRLRDEPVPAEEFDLCRRYLSGMLATSIETPQQ